MQIIDACQLVQF